MKQKFLTHEAFLFLREERDTDSEGSEVDERDYRYDPDEGYMRAMESDEAFTERIEAWMGALGPQ